MNILYVLRNIEGGGNSSRFWGLHMPLIKSKKFDITLLTSNPRKKQLCNNLSSIDNLKLIFLSKNPRNFIEFYSKAIIYSKHNHNEYDLIHDDYSPSSIYSCLWHDNCVATIHEIFLTNVFNRYGLKGVIPFFNEHIYRYLPYNQIICPSLSTSKLLNHLNVPNIIIPNGIDIDLFNKHPIKNNNKIVISMISRFYSIKGHTFFINMAYKIWKINKNVLFFLPGDGPEIEKMKMYASRLNVPISFLGYISDEKIRKLLHNTDIYVHTSFQEGFGISICEAMASKVPIVAFDVPGVRDLVKPEYGFLCKFGDVDALTNSVLQLVNDGNLRNLFGENAYKEVVNKYTWELLSKQMSTVYNKLK
jgi:glycosyltransferase involved in cell wall biosynthesis